MLQQTRISLALRAAFGVTALVGSWPTLAQQQLERVEITGSSLRRVDAETALPVTVLKADDLIKQGVTTTEQAMQRIAANQASLIGSSAISGTTGAKAEADLRGLSGPNGSNSNKTLVLLNGRRLANHPFDAAAVDLNAIPLAAIDRIEVLRDGASAVYGTDAIGGVINFITRRDFQGLEISAESQAPQLSGGDIKRLNLTTGFGSLAKQGFNVVATLDWRRQEGLEAAERNFSKTGVLGPTATDLTNGTSGTSFPGDVGGFEPSGPNCNPPNSLPSYSSAGVFQSCRYDFARDVDLLSASEQYTGLIRGSLALAGEHTLSFELVRANNKATSQIAPAPNIFTIPTTHPNYPSGALGVDADPNTPGIQPPTVVDWRLVPAGKRTSGDNTTNQRLMTEVQGVLAGFDYRAALGQAMSKSEATTKQGYVRDDLIQAGIDLGVINPFGPQSAAGSAAIEAAQVRAPVLAGKSTVDFVDARISKDLFQLPAGLVAAAWGVERRTEKSKLEAFAVTAELSSLGIDPDSDTAGKRDVTALFTEWNIPIVRSLDVTLAARYDRYSDFGNTINPKLGMRWQPKPELLIRSSYNKGFRAPTLYEIYQPSSLTFTGSSYDDPSLCPGGVATTPGSESVVCGQQVLRRFSGPGGVGRPIAALAPEKSNAYNLGFVVEPVASVNFGLDFWFLNIKQLIGGVTEQAIFEDPAKYASRFVRCSQLSAVATAGVIDRTDVNACLQYPNYDPIAYIDVPTENLGNLKTRGVDVSFGWRLPASAYGHFALSLEGTYVDQYKYQRERDGQYFYAAGKFSDNAPVFRWQHVASINWRAGAWSAIVANRFKSGYTDQDGINEVKQYSTFDTTLTYSGVKNLTISAGILNTLNQEPPRSTQINSAQLGYDPRFTDPLGRTYLLRVAYRLL